MEEWMPQQGESITVTVEQLDESVARMRQLRKAYDDKKSEATLAHNELEESEKILKNLLKASGKSKYEAEGIGLAYIVTKETFPTPKTNQQKTALFNYIKEKHGADALMSLVGVNHNTLNSWAKKELEADPLVEIPGLDQPTSEEILHFRKKD